MIGEIRDATPERQAQYAQYERIVRSRLESGTAATYGFTEMLRDAGVPIRRFFGWLRQHQTFADRVGMTTGPTGHQNVVWRLKR